MIQMSDRFSSILASATFKSRSEPKVAYTRLDEAARFLGNSSDDDVHNEIKSQLQRDGYR